MARSKRPRKLDLRFAKYLEEEENTKRRKIFVQGGLAPECFSKVILTTHSEVILHDEFAAMRDQFGLLGAKADELKRRQSDLNYLMDMGRLTREKLRALWRPRRCPRTSVV